MKLEKSGVNILKPIDKTAEKKSLDVKVQPFSYKFGFQSHFLLSNDTILISIITFCL